MELKKNYIRESFINIGCFLGIISFVLTETTIISKGFKLLLDLILIPAYIYFLGHLFYCLIKLIQSKGGD